MSDSAQAAPAAGPVRGLVHRRSVWSVTTTVERMVAAISDAGATLFATIDHSGEAEQRGLSLRNTKLLIFGNPVAGTPLMEEFPLVALDLPLKILIWEDGAGVTWLSFLTGAWLAQRHGIDPARGKVLSAPEALVQRALDAT